jgi:hypothetical protein
MSGNQEIETANEDDPWADMTPFKRDVLLRSASARGLGVTGADETLFHYTSPDAFANILENGQLWVSNSAYLNDQGELTYPIELGRAVLREYWASEEELIVKQFVARVARELDDHAGFKSWYVVSFSSKGNLLSQWRAYCPRGGYSIGFDGGELLKLLQEEGQYRLGPVLYDIDAQKQKVRAIAEHHLALFRELRSKYGEISDDEYVEELAFVTEIALSQEFTFFKAPAFAEEHEWRAVRFVHSDESVRVRDRAGMLMPYLEADVRVSSGLLPIKKIFVSPLGDQELATHAARILLRKKGYRNIQDLIETPAYRLRF